MIAALNIELLKFYRSSVVRYGTGIYFIGFLALFAMVSYGLLSGNKQLLAKAGIEGNIDWQALLIVAGQLATGGGLLTCGVITTWIFAREFMDRTVLIVIAGTVPRGDIALAKFIIVFVWSVGVHALLAVTLAGIGVVLGYGLDPLLIKIMGFGVLAMWVTAPVAWVATKTRSYFAGIAATILLIVVVQMLGMLQMYSLFFAGAPLAIALGVCAAWRSWVRLRL